MHILSRSLFTLTLLFVSSIFFTHTANALQAGDIDQSFFTGVPAGTNDTVRTITLQPDGKILIGGEFTVYNNTTANRIARLNADGTLDTTFTTGTGASSIIYTTTLQPDGKILIGGYFTKYNNTTTNRIARLNADGTRDTTFTTGTGASNSVSTTTLQPDGKILIGGWFTTYNGTTANYIARLNADGTLDTTFTTGTGASSTVYTITLQPDGKILIGGWFTTYNGTTANYIARLNADGTLDTTFTTGTGASNSVLTITLQPDGKILISGNFTTVNGTTANRIARLNADGTLDTTFITGTGANNYVLTITLQPDNKAIIGGGFTNYNGTPAAYLTRIFTTPPPADTHNLSITVASHISLDCTHTGNTNDKTIEFGTITPGTPITQSLTCTVSTNSTNGYTLTTQRNTATATMRKDATHYITDRTNWDPQNPNATLWQTHDTGLAFTVYSSTANKNNTWWGTGTTYDDTNNRYAGIPQTAQSIMTTPTYSATPTETHIGYKPDVPTTQQAGIYSGIVTYQVTVNP